MTRTAVVASLVLHAAALTAVCIPFGAKMGESVKVMRTVTTLLRPPPGEQPKGPRASGTGHRENLGAAVDLSQIEVVLDDGHVADLIQVLEDWNGSVTTCGATGHDLVPTLLVVRPHRMAEDPRHGRDTVRGLSRWL